MFDRLKNKIKNWLFKEDLQNLQNEMDNISRMFDTSIDRLREARDYYLDAQSSARSVHQMMTEMLNVGIDIHLKEPHSWAVICIKGKPEYIKFINLGNDNKTAREIMMWLRQFEGSNITVNSPFTNYFKEEIKHWKY
jgi:hypothetical protein